MRILAPFLLLFAAACTSATEDEQPMVSPILTGEEAKDPWTFARPEVARVTHVDLDLALDFEAKQVGGTATLDIEAEPGADTVVHDSNGLAIAGFTDEAGNALPFTVGEAVEDKGTPVRVTIGEARRIALAVQAEFQPEGITVLQAN